MIPRPRISSITFVKLSSRRNSSRFSQSAAAAAAAAAATAKPSPSSSLHHHDLASFIAHARRACLSPTSTLYTGTRYEYLCLHNLARLSFALTRTGGRADHGIDLLGHWRLPSLPYPLRVLVQCKALRSKPTPALIRELEGIYAGAPAGWRNGETTVAVLVAKRQATRGVREAVRCSRVPVVWVMLEDVAERAGCEEAEAPEGETGRVRQILWNAKVIGLGAEGVGVGVRYLPPTGERVEGGEVEKEVVLTWKGEMWEPAMAGKRGDEE